MRSPSQYEASDDRQIRYRSLSVSDSKGVSVSELSVLLWMVEAVHHIYTVYPRYYRRVFWGS